MSEVQVVAPNSEKVNKTKYLREKKQSDPRKTVIHVFINKCINESQICVSGC